MTEVHLRCKDKIQKETNLSGQEGRKARQSWFTFVALMMLSLQADDVAEREHNIHLFATAC